MTLLSGIKHTEVAEPHHPWPRAVVAEDGWQQAIDQLETGRCSLLGLWGDAPGGSYGITGQGIRRCRRHQLYL